MLRVDQNVAVLCRIPTCIQLRDVEKINVGGVDFNVATGLDADDGSRAGAISICDRQIAIHTTQIDQITVSRRRTDEFIVSRDIVTARIHKGGAKVHGNALIRRVDHFVILTVSEVDVVNDALGWIGSA